MTRLHKDVDFGGAYLDVGQGGGAGDGTGELPLADALALFERHMGQGDGRGARGSGRGLQDVFNEIFLPPAAAMPSIEVAPDGSAGVAGGAADAGSLVDAVQELWVMHGADGRELRLHALGERLADVAMRMREDAGRLVIEFEAAAGASRDWLSPRLRGLAGHLGRHLDRPLGVSLSSPAGAQENEAPHTVRWPEDFDA